MRKLFKKFKCQFCGKKINTGIQNIARHYDNCKESQLSYPTDLNEMKKAVCSICGKKATKVRWSITGSIPYPVCEYHYENTTPILEYKDAGSSIMGLIDNKSGELLEFKYRNSYSAIKKLIK